VSLASHLGFIYCIDGWWFLKFPLKETVWCMPLHLIHWSMHAQYSSNAVRKMNHFSIGNTYSIIGNNLKFQLRVASCVIFTLPRVGGIGSQLICRHFCLLLCFLARTQVHVLLELLCNTFCLKPNSLQSAQLIFHHFVYREYNMLKISSSYTNFSLKNCWLRKVFEFPLFYIL
jgi:hypothetical protein